MMEERFVRMRSRMTIWMRRRTAEWTRKALFTLTLIEKSPKVDYAVLLLHMNIRGREFYSRMLLTRDPANRSRNDAVYRENTYQLLEEIVKNFS